MTPLMEPLNRESTDLLDKLIKQHSREEQHSKNLLQKDGVPKQLVRRIVGSSLVAKMKAHLGYWKRACVATSSKIIGWVGICY